MHCTGFPSLEGTTAFPTAPNEEDAFLFHWPFSRGITGVSHIPDTTLQAGGFSNLLSVMWAVQTHAAPGPQPQKTPVGPCAELLPPVSPEGWHFHCTAIAATDTDHPSLGCLCPFSSWAPRNPYHHCFGHSFEHDLQCITDRGNGTGTGEQYMMTSSLFYSGDVKHWLPRERHSWEHSRSGCTGSEQLDGAEDLPAHYRGWTL